MNDKHCFFCSIFVVLFDAAVVNMVFVVLLAHISVAVIVVAVAVSVFDAVADAVNIATFC